jgi:hypothetical protein
LASNTKLRLVRSTLEQGCALPFRSTVCSPDLTDQLGALTTSSTIVLTTRSPQVFTSRETRALTTLLVIVADAPQLASPGSSTVFAAPAPAPTLRRAPQPLVVLEQGPESRPSHGRRLTA